MDPFRTLQILKAWPPEYISLCSPIIVCALCGPHLLCAKTLAKGIGSADPDLLEQALKRMAKYWAIGQMVLGSTIKIPVPWLRLTPRCRCPQYESSTVPEGNAKKSW